MRIGTTIGQFDVNGHMRVAVRFGHPASVLKNIALTDLKDDVDGILADDRRKPSGRGLDQVADGKGREPDPSVDRGADLSINEIDFRLRELRLRFQYARLRCFLVRGALVEGGLRDV